MHRFLQKVGPVLALVALLATAPEELMAAAGGSHELMVELLDGTGAPVTDLSDLDLEVYVADEPVEARAVGGDVDWRITILFDRLLSESRLIHSAALDLSEMADEVVALGEVEIVLGGDEYTRAMLPTRDAEELRQALTWLRIREGGDAAQLAVRRQFERDFHIQELGSKPYAAVSATAAMTVSELRFGVRRALEEERRIVEEYRRSLLDWLLENRRGSPSLLVMVSGGDDEPLSYYSELLADAGLAEVLEELDVRPAEPGRFETGQAVSSLGWTTLAYAPGFSDARLNEQAPGSRPGDDSVETVVQDGEVVDRTMLGSFDPRDLFRRSAGEEERPLEPRLLAPLAGLGDLADVTGGDLATDRQTLRRVLVNLQDRIRVEVSRRSPTFSAESVRVEVAGDGADEVAQVRARHWLSAGTPEALAEIRARRLLLDGIEEGPLMVTAQQVTRAGVDLVIVELEPAADTSLEIGGSPLRLTVGMLDEDERSLFRHSIVAGDGPMTETPGGGLLVETELGLRTRSSRPVVVLVEDLESGRWGGTYATLVGAGGDIGSELMMSLPRAVRLLEPEDRMVVGMTMFQVIHDPEVERVDFFLDGELAAQRAASPFAVRLDLGRLPEPHRVEVVAYDGNGRELGRDRLSLNESGGIFRLRIVRPRLAEAGDSDHPLVGPVEVEAHIEVPRSAVLARVEYFWNDSLVATRYAAPYVQRVPVPSEDPQGFFRVVAHLEDGSSAEDVVFVNSPGGSERVKVELIQLYAVVTDRDGRPFQGLGKSSFRVLEEGVEQEIAAFNEAKEQPLTVGLAIDASASMFVKLPRVQKAARSFLQGLDDSKDRAFLVDFGTEPRLHHDTSRDLEGVEAALDSLTPDGRTAIWKGIAFSLVQLQGVPGKKALIVFSDGADEDPDFSFRTSLKFAQRVGVPIYVIVSNDEIYRTGGRGLNVRGFINRLESLTRSVGGRVFFSRVGEDLEEIYAQIDDELRSQYLLGYYARDTDEDRWRSVRIEVDAPGARARTVAGYFR